VSAQAFDLGVVLRSSVIASRHLSVGVELGYDWTVFNSLSTSNGQGAYDPPPNPDRDVSGNGHNGDQAHLDFSGPHVALVIGLWTGMPGF
jgi:hypothetical protein